MTEDQLKEIEVLQDELICKGGPKKGKPKKDADPAKLARLKDLLDSQRAEQPGSEAARESKDESGDSKKDLVQAERELRRYVKKDGSGFRKSLPDEARAEAKRLMGILGRKEPVWDENIVVPGM